MIKWKKWDILAGFLLLVGTVLLFGAAGTSDVKSLDPDIPGLASDTTVFVLTILGCASALAGVAILIRKGGKS